MADTPEVIATMAREAQLAQLSSIDGLDTKAASLIGFAGVLLGLLFTAPATVDRWNAAMSIGAAALIISIVPLAVALVPRTYAFNPNISALVEGWGTAKADEVHEAATQSIIRALLRNIEILRFKALFVRLGATLLVSGLLFASAGMLYAVNQDVAPAKVSAVPKKGK
jgi:hypothetical protein